LTATKQVSPYNVFSASVFGTACATV